MIDLKKKKVGYKILENNHKSIQTILSALMLKFIYFFDLKLFKNTKNDVLQNLITLTDQKIILY